VALVLADRVKESTTTSGTGTLTLTGAQTGFQSFTSAVGIGNTTYYTIQATGAAIWEVGIGTVGSGTLSRDVVLASSSGAGNKITLPGTTFDVFCDYPAPKSVYQDDSSIVNAPQYTATKSISSAANQGAFNYGTLSFSDSNLFASMQNSVDSYNQFAIQNTSSGGSASGEYVAYNNNGTATTNYVSMGINSSAYSGVGALNSPGYGFLATASTDLAIGTLGSNSIHFTINNGATDAMVINTSGNIGINGNPAVKFAITGTDAMLIPVGTTAQRPTGAAGYFRYNSTLTAFEGFNGTAWSTLGNPTIQNTAPSSPVSGNQWWDSEYGRTNIYYNDGTSSQWVAGQPSPDGILLDSLDGGSALTTSYSRFIINCGGAT